MQNSFLAGDLSFETTILLGVIARAVHRHGGRSVDGASGLVARRMGDSAV